MNLVKIYLETKKCFSPTPCWSQATLIFSWVVCNCLPSLVSLLPSLVNRVSSSLYSQNHLLKYRSDHVTTSDLHGGLLSHIRENCSPYSGQKPWTIWASTSLISDPHPLSLYSLVTLAFRQTYSPLDLSTCCLSSWNIISLEHTWLTPCFL